VNKFQKRDSSVEASELELKLEDNLIDVLVDNDLAESRSDAKRKIEQGGVSIDGRKIELGQVVDESWDGKILKVGKKDFRKIKIS